MASGTYKKVKTSVSAALADGASVISELAEEMGEWRDNLEEKLSHTDKYERVSEAAELLEGSDMESLCDALVTAIEEASEGKPAKLGCPAHVVGTACPVCKWSGVLNAGRPLVIERLDAPRPASWEGGPPSVARIGAVYYSSLAAWAKDAARARAKFEAANQIPAERKAEPEVKALFEGDESLGGDGLGDHEIEVSEFHPYKGKSASRATRCSDACALIRSACDEVESALDELTSLLDTEAERASELAEEELEEEQQVKRDRIDEIRGALDEVTNALDELEGVEFPGMYG